MEKMIVNELDFKTFNFLKANETSIEIPNLELKDYHIESDQESLELKEIFKAYNYGLSKDLLVLNENNRNLYKSYLSDKGKKESYILKISLDDSENQLLDIHDLVAKESSSLSLILDYSSNGEKDKFRHSLIRILAKKDSEVSVFIIEKEDKKTISLESIAIIGEDEAKINLCQYHLGGGKVNSNYKCNLIGEKAQSYVNSIYFADKEDEKDLFYNLVHQGEKTKSSILINGALRDKAKKTLRTNLDFKKGAKGAVGSEEEYVVLLDESVNNISIPLMLCHEDDVEGNHSANAGKIDPDILFYIMSRGFSHKEAETIIIESKFSSAIDLIEDEKLKKELWKTIAGRIKGED